jgi:hypothetical protein
MYVRKALAAVLAKIQSPCYPPVEGVTKTRYVIYKVDIPSVCCSTSSGASTSSGEIDRLSFPFNDLYVPALIPRLYCSETPLQSAEVFKPSRVGIAQSALRHSYVLDGPGSIPGMVRFSHLHSVQTGSGAHQASSPMGNGGDFPGGKADHSPPSSSKVENGGAIPPLSDVFIA